MQQHIALTLEDIAVLRGGRLLLSGVSFEAPPGAFIALRGPNGSGKTSLLKVIAGLARPSAGDARLSGEAVGESEASLVRDPEAYRERILFGGHLDGVKPGFSLRENLMFWADFYAAGAESERTAERVDAALERFGLAALADAPAGHCSAGQKRRLGLARLAASDRPVWMLDEPTVSLDAASVEALSELIAAHCRAGGVAIAATHQEFAITESRAIDVSQFAPDPAAARATQGEGDPFADPFLAGFDAPEKER